MYGVRAIKSLPNELVLEIADYLGPKDLHSFLRASQLLAVLLSPMLLGLAVSTNTLVGIGERTVLHWAASDNRCSLMTILLERGARVDTYDTNGMTPLHSAILNGNEAAVKLLLDNGAPIEPADRDSLTPLHYAVLLGKHTIVKMLLDKGACTCAWGHEFEGGTPLLCAAAMGYVAVVQVLAEHAHGPELNPQLTNNLGVNALQIARASGQEDMVKWLLDFGGFSSNQLPEFMEVPHTTIYGRDMVENLFFTECLLSS